VHFAEKWLSGIKQWPGKMIEQELVPFNRAIGRKHNGFEIVTCCLS
jgi:hypothetical protein